MAEPVQMGTKPRKKRTMKKRWVILALVLALLLAGGFFAMRFARSRALEVTDVTYQETAVARRDITNSLTGSGTLQPADSYTVTTLVSGEILSDHFAEGDWVEKEQLLYTIDASQMENSLTQAQRSYENAVKAKYPTAPISGTVLEVNVKNGQNVGNNTQICRISGSDGIYFDFPFSYVESKYFYAGQTAEIYLDGFESSITGTVEKVSEGTALGNGLKLTTVRVRTSNTGYITEETTAKAYIGSYVSYGNTYANLTGIYTVNTSGSGTVTELNILPGDTVTVGERLCVLTGDSIDNQLENAELSLENTQNNLDNYQITSPISGTVIEKYAKAGDNAGTGGNNSSTLCIIYDLSYLEMTLSIDELDISKVSVGQEVRVTADAVEGKVYEGVVTKTSVVGSTQGGTTTYPVTVRIMETEGLLPGMNVDAEIFLSAAENVIAVPNGAVNRGNTVLVTKNSPSAANALEQEAPEGYVYVAVTTGESDDSYIEITSGLQEGDTVAYIRTSSGNGFGMGMMPGGMPGGFGGGMPSGGMPGGMPGGGMPSGGFSGGGMPSGGPGGGFR